MFKTLNWMKSLRETYRVDKNAEAICEAYCISSVDSHLFVLHVWILVMVSLPFTLHSLHLTVFYFSSWYLHLYTVILILCLSNSALTVSSVRIVSLRIFLYYPKYVQLLKKSPTYQWFNIVMNYFFIVTVWRKVKRSPQSCV